MGAFAARVFFGVVLVAGSLSIGLTASGPPQASPSWASGCIAQPVLAGEETYRYKHQCSGHDEPEIDPLSDLPGSAKDLT